jgi:WS/DGAT/MGAT family acyltransferase
MSSTKNGARSRLSVLDSTFLRIETSDTPMHVGALMTFEIPEGAGPTFVSDVVARLREPLPLRRPFNQVLAGGRLAPAARTLEAIDMDYHVRHTALPAPGGERELGELISHLHSTRLDRSRPLWTSHVIEGLAPNRFAIYIKIHHSLTDGVNGVRLATDQLATDPDGYWQAPWHAAPPNERRRRPRPPKAKLAPHRAAAALTRGLVSLRRPSDDSEPVRVPFEAPRSVVNAPVTNARRVATQQLDIERVREIAKASNTSMNDVFLAVCGDALRRYLMDRDQLPERSLVAGVPVSLREEGQEGGNAVGFLWSVLGTDVADPHERLAAVNRSMRASKEHIKAIAPSVRPVFTLMTMALPIAVLLTGQGARLKRPSMNVTISNVPGPSTVRYLGGARMDACYPMSLLFQGLGLNITCISYGGQLNVGVVGGRDALPSLQKIAVHLGDALDALETEVAAP